MNACNRPAAALAVLTLAAATLGSGPARAENWPMWRGAKGDSVCAEKTFPTKWSGTENVTWKTELKAPGGSTPVVWDDRIYLTAQTEDEVEWAISLDRATGKVAWEREVGKGKTKTRAGANMASASPATDGERVVVTFGTGELACFDRDGKEIWKKNLQQDNGKFTIWWGYSSSPVIHGDHVFVSVINEGPSYLIAYDKKTGAVAWKTERDTPAKSESEDSYATPMVYPVEGGEEVFVTGGQWATAYNPATGELLWKADLGGDRTILSPTFYDGVIYVTAGKRGPIHAIKPGGRGDVTQTHVLWNWAKSTPDVPCPVGLGPNLYALNDTGVLLVIKRATGELVYQNRVGGDMFATPVACDGKLYMTNRAGKTTVIEAGDEYKVVAENEIGEDGHLASLAFSDGQIFQRTLKSLYCIGERRK